MTDATAPIGHNNPPEPTPYEAILTDVQDLSETAQGFLDGDPINDQATADMVAKLIDEARKGQKAAEDLRKEEAKPFDDGKKAVQAKRSEEHTSELQSLMRISYAVFCLKKKNKTKKTTQTNTETSHIRTNKKTHTQVTLKHIQ